jgi:phage/plasmid primase-like uncharacterized protein
MKEPFTRLFLKAKAVPIEKVIEQRGIALRRNGVEREGPCPICGGDDRFSINTKEHVWNCRGCEKGGDVIALVRHLDGCDLKTAVYTLTDTKPKQQPRTRDSQP